MKKKNKSGKKKLKAAFYWCSSCGGCEESFIDLSEDLLKLTKKVDIVFWPVAMDYKYKDVEKLKDKEIDVSFINGGIRVEDQEKIAKLLRKKSQIVVAYGSCAHLGGVPGLANLWSKDQIFNCVYRDVPSLKGKKVYPQEKVKINKNQLELPKFFDSVRSLNQVIDVDYYLPGCSPPLIIIQNALKAIIKGKLPAKGSVLSPNWSLCKTCSLNESKPTKIKISELKRVHEIHIDPNTCYLEQGLVCLGPVTRTGCEERCIKGNMPCRGCFGPTDQVFDMGAKFLSVFASLIETDKPDEIEKIAKSLGEVSGMFNRYCLPVTLLSGKVEEKK